MCNQYKLPSPDRLFKDFHLDAPAGYRQIDVFPRSPGYFIRRSTHQAAYARELVLGQWGLIPWFTKSLPLPYSTNNARSEELELKASYKEPWRKGQRCIIPAAVFWEPNWESGKNVWWSFQRADGHAFGLAGLWNTWIDPGTGEVHESYTMLTLNADHHPLMNRMHKPDPKLPPDRQDKRMVVVLEPALWDAWLEAPVEQARPLIAMAPVEDLQAGPDAERRAGLAPEEGASATSGQGSLNF